MENPYKNHFHLEPSKGLLNDPNGLCYYEGTYYVFHQWNRFNLDHSYKEWGYFTSKDLLNWEEMGTALLPDTLEDAYGVYSGSALVSDGNLELFYTGNTKFDGLRKSFQKTAVSSDGKTFIKSQSNLTTPDEFTEHFRDPKVFKKGSDYFMIVGGQLKNGQGAIALYSSDNRELWNYKGVLYTDSSLDQMAECPDLIDYGTQQLLLVCPQKRNLAMDFDESSYSGYIIGKMKKNIFYPENEIRPVDQGFDFYSPQTFTDKKGRTIMIAWMSRMNTEEEKTCPTIDFGYIHCLTMPREVKVVDGKLIQLPLLEYQDAFIPSKESYVMEYVLKKEAAMMLEIEFYDLESEFMIDFFLQTTTLSYKDKNLSLCRKSWANNQFSEKKMNLNGLRKLQIFIDQSAIEIFINNGDAVMSLRYFTKNKDIKIKSSKRFKITVSKKEI